MKRLNTNQLGKTGKFGEDSAFSYLTNLGYEILGRNVVCDGHEIDIIACDIKYVVFVEVKTRTAYHGLSRFGSAASAVDRNKQRSIITASKAYMNQTRLRRVPRYDVIEVYVNKSSDRFTIEKINHIPRAFGSGR